MLKQDNLVGRDSWNKLLPTRKDILCILGLCGGEVYRSDMVHFFYVLHDNKYDLDKALNYLVKEKLVIEIKPDIYKLSDNYLPLEERMPEVLEKLTSNKSVPGAC